MPSTPLEADRAVRRGAPDAVLIGLLALHVLALLLLPRVVTVDGPGHLAGGEVLASFGDSPLLQRFYEVDLSPLPNMLPTLLLGGLLSFLGPDLAEKLLVGLCLVLLPLAVRYALRGVDARAGWLAVAAVPFATGYLLYYGFYGFCLATGLAFLAIGVALRRTDGWTWRAALLLAGLTLVTWTSHLLPLLVAGLVVALLALERTRTAWRAGAHPGQAALRHLVPPALAGLPVLLLTAVFSQSEGAGYGDPVRRGLVELLLGFFTSGRVLVVYSRWEYVAATAITLVLAWLALRRRAALVATPERRALLAAALIMSVVYFASPDRFGEEYGFLNDRFAYFPPLLLLLAAAQPLPRRRTGPAVVALLVVATVSLALLRIPTEIKWQRDVEEMVAVSELLPRGSVVLAVQLWRDPPAGAQVRNPVRDPLRHETSRIAVLIDGVDVGHYEAATAYFPARFRDDASPRRLVDPGEDGLSAVPPDVDLAAGVPVVDAVLVVGRREAGSGVVNRPDARRVLGELEEHYRLTGVSAPTGLVEVWQRR